MKTSETMESIESFSREDARMRGLSASAGGLSSYGAGYTVKDGLRLPPCLVPAPGKSQSRGRASSSIGARVRQALSSAGHSHSNNHSNLPPLRNRPVTPGVWCMCECEFEC